MEERFFHGYIIILKIYYFPLNLNKNVKKKIYLLNLLYKIKNIIIKNQLFFSKNINSFSILEVKNGFLILISILISSESFFDSD